MSGRLKDALLDNAERSYATRPIDLPAGAGTAGRSRGGRAMNAEPSLNSEQLSFLK